MINTKTAMKILKTKSPDKYLDRFASSLELSKNLKIYSIVNSKVICEIKFRLSKMVEVHCTLLFWKQSNSIHRGIQIPTNPFISQLDGAKYHMLCSGQLFQLFLSMTPLLSLKLLEQALKCIYRQFIRSHCLDRFFLICYFLNAIYSQNIAYHSLVLD